MRVLHFVDYFTQPTQTFIKRYVQKSMQFADTAIASFDFFDVPEDIKEKASLLKIDNPHFSKKTASGLKRYLSETLTGEKFWYKRMSEIIDSFRPDIVHCHFGYLGIFMMEFNNKYHKQIPFVTTIYAYDITSLPLANKQYRKGLAELWKKGDAFFAEGPSLKEKFIAYGCPESKCIINPLLIPIDEYPVKTSFRKPGEPVKFLFVGRFVEKKGFHVFLRVLGRLKTRIGPFTLDIIGDGPMNDTFRQIAAEEQLEGNIKWHGMVNHAEIIPMLKDYDFLAHSSLRARDGDSEGGSATIIVEALAVGLPVITTNHDDIPFVMGYHDFLAEENDMESLADVLLKILNCENIADFAERGREKVAGLHDLQLNTSYEANLRKLAGK